MDTERVLVAAGVVAVFTLLFTVVVPLGRALVKRMEGGGTPPDGLELDEIRARLQSLEAREPHLAELEERLDFAERLLTRERPLPGLDRADTPPEASPAAR
jgi:hypothetical protein